MIHCCEILFVQLDTVVVLFVELRGLTRGIFKLGSLVFRVSCSSICYLYRMLSIRKSDKSSEKIGKLKYLER